MKKLFLSIALSLMFLGCGGTNNEPEKQSNYDSKQFEVQLSQNIVDVFKEKIKIKDIELDENFKIDINSEGILNVYKIKKDKKKMIATISKKDKEYTGDFIASVYDDEIIVIGTAKKGRVTGVVKMYKKTYKTYDLIAYSIYNNGNGTGENYIMYHRMHHDGSGGMLYDTKDKYGILKTENFHFNKLDSSETNILYSMEGKLISIVKFDDNYYYENDVIVLNEKKQKIKHMIRTEDQVKITNYDEKGEEQDTIIYY